MSQRKQRIARRASTTVPPHVLVPSAVLPARRALAIPVTFTLLLAAMTWLPVVQRSLGLLWAFIGAATLLSAWAAMLLLPTLRSARALAVEFVPRKQHYLQACAQGAVLVYWGAYWTEVYDFAYLIAAQILFAYAFDALLAWSRRDTWTLGFGPFPVVFSTNLFLWFKPDWFYLQFVMVGAGFAAKELIRWTRDGRRVHVFNPSSFPLAIASIVLIATSTTHRTWGEQIATTQLLPPQMYPLIFLVALPGQFLFGVASMTLAAVATAAACNLAYFAATGGFFFMEPSVPIAVFLGMHLLFTDPSTSPRTELGRLLFGVLYGLSVVVLFALLGRAGAPTFYDKLLAVPILNLLVRAIDRFVQAPSMRWLDPAALGKALTPRRRHLVYIAVWTLVFTTMHALTAKEVTVARGDVLLSLGRFDEAIRSFREVVAADPNHDVAYGKLGLALSQAGRFEEAAVALERAAERRPDDPDTQVNLGASLLQGGRVTDAVPVLERAVELRPSHPESRFNLAQAYTRVGRPADAVRELQRALQLRPGWAPALEALAWVQAAADDIAVRNATTQPLGDGVHESRR